jgi:type I restriction enzyme S subunit
MAGDFAAVNVEDIALEMGDAPFGSHLKNDDYTDEGALVVQGKNVQGRVFDWTDKRHVSIEKWKSIPRSHCFPGDLIFPKVGTIGKVGILSKCPGYDKYLLSTNTMRLRVDLQKADPLYIYYYFTWSKIVNLIHALNSKSVVLDNSNVEKLASNPYLLVHALPQEDHNDTDDASSGYVYPILMPESTVQAVQSSRRRPYRASVVDRETQAHRTAALYRLHPGVLRASGHVDGPEQVA